MERELVIRLDQCLRRTIRDMERSFRAIEGVLSKIRKLSLYKRAEQMEVKKVEQKLELAFA